MLLNTPIWIKFIFFILFSDILFNFIPSYISDPTRSDWSCESSAWWLSLYWYRPKRNSSNGSLDASNSLAYVAPISYTPLGMLLQQYYMKRFISASFILYHQGTNCGLCVWLVFFFISCLNWKTLEIERDSQTKNYYKTLYFRLDVYKYLTDCLYTTR